jgi:hypothetical protein
MAWRVLPVVARLIMERGERSARIYSRSSVGSFWSGDAILMLFCSDGREEERAMVETKVPESVRHCLDGLPDGLPLAAANSPLLSCCVKTLY